MDYPEHEKLKEIQSETQFLGEFLDWLSSKEMAVCVYDDNAERWRPHRESITGLLAKFKNIDLQKIEYEKRQMLASLNPLNV